MTWRFMAVLSIFAGGCTLYFDGPPPPDASGNEPTPSPPDASVACPKPGTYAEILYPLDGATNVPQPVPIKMHVFIPNTLDGKGIYLSDANGTQVDLEHYDASCSMQIPPIQTGSIHDVTWVQCYSDLEPNTEYTWHIWITCYDDTGAHEIATSTFRTAP